MILFKPFVLAITFILNLWISPLTLNATPQEYPHGDGRLRIFNYHLNDFLEVTFRENGKTIPQGIERINQLLRSRDNAETTSINLQLLDLIDHLQDHFGADTIEIISGYRRKEFNEQLLKTGHAVSPVSLHTQGKALDIHIDEIREETLRDYLLNLKLGGVGYYGPLDFVHIDTGPVRRWGGNFTGRKLVGVLDPEAPIQLTSDKNDYLPGETLNFEWKFKEGNNLEKIKDLSLERFWRGKWIPCSIKIEEIAKLILPFSKIQCGYGKYRWVFKLEGNSSILSSNEFYLKKQ